MIIRFFSVLLAALLAVPTMAGATTLETIKQRGWLACGGRRVLRQVE